MNIVREPGPGYPCPTLFVWNGSEYVEEDTLGIHGDSDITLLYGIETLVPDGNFYKLSLRELDEFTSHIDYLKLYTVDNNAEKHPCYLVQAVHSELGHVTRPLRFDDNRRVDLAPQQTINLAFFLPQKMKSTTSSSKSTATTINRKIKKHLHLSPLSYEFS